MLNTILLAATYTTPRAADWSPTVGLIMVACNLLALAIAKFTVQKQDDNSGLPSIAGFSLPLLLAGTAFGHILGTGVILGLSNIGAI